MNSIDLIKAIENTLEDLESRAADYAKEDMLLDSVDANELTGAYIAYTKAIRRSCSSIEGILYEYSEKLSGMDREKAAWETLHRGIMDRRGSE